MPRLIRKLKTTPQRSNNPWTLDLNIRGNELDLELQPSRPAVPSRPVFGFPRMAPALPPRPVVLSGADTSSETITFPEPAAYIPSPPGTVAGSVADSVRSFRPGSALYYCRYSEDGNRSDTGSQSGRDNDSMDGYCVFREKDLALNNRANVLSPSLDDCLTDDWQGVDSGDSTSVAMTITPGGMNAAMESTDTIIRYPIGRRVSAFTEVLSFESSSVHSSALGDNTESQMNTDAMETLRSGERLLYLHIPWILRFFYIFIFSNWWTLIPLMKVSSGGLHPENLPLVYACGMLTIIIINIVLQINHFRLHGVPWGRRRRAEKIQDEKDIEQAVKKLDPLKDKYAGNNGTSPSPGIDLESNRNESRATLKKDKNRRKWRMRTGMESYVFAVDMILLMLTLAVLAASIVFVRHGSAMHELQMAEAATKGTPNGEDGGFQTSVVQLYGDDIAYKLH
ncbi:hypothetical protein TWF718_002219 [Orbilia javanica]|uniref:Uncharacterized protein n=1 Tax=Orbilia javanica TaxID=47235 RepID=A0AAN8MM54_9PEZI